MWLDSEQELTTYQNKLLFSHIALATYELSRLLCPGLCLMGALMQLIATSRCPCLCQNSWNEHGSDVIAKLPATIRNAHYHPEIIQAILQGRHQLLYNAKMCVSSSCSKEAMEAGTYIK